MEIHPEFGPVLVEDGWVPAPRFLLRRRLVLDRLARSDKGTLLDIGCGPATVLYELASQGWRCTGLEQSVDALEIARKLHGFPGGAEIREAAGADWANRFDWILSMEVLEHIEKDLAALEEWRGWLKPDGRLLLSVPAHMKKWSHSDVWAGHFRRYERKQLEKLLQRAGFEVENIVNYGYPVSNIIEPIRAWHHGRLLEDARSADAQTPSKREGTDKSGTVRTLEKKLFPYFSGVFGVYAFRVSAWLQEKFLDTDLGTGYLVQARKADR